MITGIDLIKQQIRIADKKKCNLKQEDIRCLGHAIECRINAEDVSADFCPKTGTYQFSEPSGRQRCACGHSHLQRL